MSRMSLEVWIECRCGKPVKVFPAISLAELRRVRDAGKPISYNCVFCGARNRRKISDQIIYRAVERYNEEQAFLASLTPARDQGPLLRSREAAFRGPIATRHAPSDQVGGAAKLYHYAVYVRHPWGTDRIVVGVKKHSIQAARDEAIDRVRRFRKTMDAKIMDAVPMKWTDNGLVEVKRRVRTKKGSLTMTRRPKARESVRQTKRKSNGH